MLFVGLATATWAQDEYRIQFTYDNAGNQTLRDRVCINCGSAKQAVDSLAVEDVVLEEDLLENAASLGNGDSTSRIVAYPNPVTNLLSVEWEADQKQVAQIVLFSGIGQQLYQKTIKSGYGNLDLNFAIYPTGRYIVSVFYTDNTKQTFHVIKK